LQELEDVGNSLPSLTSTASSCKKVISTTNAISTGIYLQSTFSREVSELENLRVSNIKEREWFPVSTQFPILNLYILGFLTQYVNCHTFNSKLLFRTLLMYRVYLVFLDLLVEYSLITDSPEEKIQFNSGVKLA